MLKQHTVELLYINYLKEEALVWVSYLAHS